MLAFSLDGLGLDLSAVGEISVRARARPTAPPLSPSRAKARASSFFRRSVWESTSGAARPPRASAGRALPHFLDTRSPLIGGLDS